MTLFLILLYALVLPYIGLMLMVIVGLLRRNTRPQNLATPSVSVIIPAHNEEDKLAATLESLSQQKYEGALEFIIVNDRSTDKTEAIIERFVAQDARFRLVNVYLPSRRLSPKVNAVNTGIQASCGELILTSGRRLPVSRNVGFRDGLALRPGRGDGGGLRREYQGK